MALFKSFLSFLPSFLSILYALVFCLHVCLYETAELGVTDSELPYGCWELNLGPQEEAVPALNC